MPHPFDELDGEASAPCLRDLGVLLAGKGNHELSQAKPVSVGPGRSPQTCPRAGNLPAVGEWAPPSKVAS